MCPALQAMNSMAAVLEIKECHNFRPKMQQLKNSNSLVFPEELIGDESSEQRGEGGEEGEGVVDDGGKVLVEAKLVLEVQNQETCDLARKYE